MEYFPAPLEALVEQFARLPGIGGKTAQRLAFHVLSLPEEEAQAFADAIVTAKKTVTYCPVCRNFTAGGLCPICASPQVDNGYDISDFCAISSMVGVAAYSSGVLPPRASMGSSMPLSLYTLKWVSLSISPLKGRGR